jgi:RimJ/RimL family protein N-acetyltransferase
MNELTLIPVNRSHAPAMFPLLADPELYHFTGGTPPESREAVESWFSSLETQLSPDGSEQWLTWIVQLNGLAPAIGYVQATVAEGHADVAWLIGADWQGQGYARKAVGLLKAWLEENQIKQISAHIHPEHRFSQQVAMSMGMHGSGVLREGEEIWVAQLGAP